VQDAPVQRWTKASSVTRRDPGESSIACSSEKRFANTKNLPRPQSLVLADGRKIPAAHFFTREFHAVTLSASWEYR